MSGAAKAGARKSLGEYKPLVVYPRGALRKTEVLEQNPERYARRTKWGVVPGQRYARGTTYATRAEAIEAAQIEIEHRRILAEDAYWGAKEAGAPERLLADRAAHVELWGGSVA